MQNLNYLNYLNLSGYIVNVLVTFASAPVFGFPDNAELSAKYQTLVTPAGFTFAIWGIIFISQAVFTIFQMLPAYRSNKLVQDGVSYWYFIACIFQSAWSFAFGYEIIWLSAIIMFSILVSLVNIVTRQSTIQSSPQDSNKEFWLYKFPFSLHCGWIATAFAVNINVFIVAQNASAGAQETWAYISLGYAISVAGMAFFLLSIPDFTIPSVLIWATIGIANELKNPNDSIENLFGVEVISQIRYSVIGVRGILLVITVAYGAYRVIKKSKIVDYNEIMSEK